MQIFKKFKNLVLNAGFENKELESIKDDVTKSNKFNLEVFSIIAIVFLSISMIASIFSSLAKSNLWYYFGEACICLIIFILSKFVVKDRHYGTNTLIYIFMSSLLVFSILIGTITSKSEKMTIYPALLLAVPLFFLDRPIKIDAVLVSSFILFIVLGIYLKDQTIFVQDLLNVVILLLVSIALNFFIIKVKYKNILYSLQLSIISDYDVLTDLRNRNCYERRLETYEKDEHNTCQIIFFDVNGLHEINNKYGHEEGDKMLKFVASKIKELFGEDNSYRIGGDEFIVLNINRFDENIQIKIDEFKKEIETKNYHVSIGYEYSMSHVSDITLLQKKAESLMYKEKKEYYLKNNISREIR